MPDNAPKALAPAECHAPIFIQGMMQRSGTNFMRSLLELHPDCEHPAPYMEDFLLREAHHLVHFAKAVSNTWCSKPLWNVPKNVKAELLGGLGNSLVDFLERRITNRRMVTKSPSVANLEHFFDVFPNAKLIILVRDGRSVVASSMRSFDTPFSVAAHRWIRAAKKVDNFMKSTDPSKFAYVRYEDLHLNTRRTMQCVLRYLELDADRYSFDAAENLPVKGSCETKEGSGRVNWQPVEKTADFNPLERWREWPPQQLEQFEYLAGDWLRRFQYDLATDIEQRPLARAKCWFTDQGHIRLAKKAPQKILRRLRLNGKQRGR